jgi:medium-chain acyl-[acyl-carrier-protein] hydrolase
LPMEHLTGDASPRSVATELSARLAPLAHASVSPPSASRAPRTGEWIVRWERLPADEARLRLFCFPFAGGGASLYRGWGKGLPRGVEVCPVQLSGRENRFGEALVEEMSVVLDTLEHELGPLLDLPFAFFGTSMGGVVAFELARRLRARRRLSPVRLFAAASFVPDRGPPSLLAEIMHNVANDVKGADPALLRRYKIVPEPVLASPDLLEKVMPPLYADLRMARSYRYIDEAPLDCPITALCGRHDPLMSREDLAAWSDHTRADFSLRMVEGEHLFVRTHRESVLRIVGSDLEDHLDEGTARAAS